MAFAHYPAIIEAADNSFSVFFPDLPGCTSAGETVQEAALNAEDAIAMHVQELVRGGDAVPEPSSLDALADDPEVEEVARLLVRVDLPGKVVRLNITLDEGLVSAIDRIARNRSGFLADAARSALAERRLEAV